MSRGTYTILLEITPTAPLTHGAGNNGNTQILRTTEVNIPAPDPKTGRKGWQKIRVPVVSGASMKSRLREHALHHLCEVLGLGDGSIDRDKLRLLLKGGKNDSGGQSVSLDEHRRLRELFPMLAVFGSMDGGLPICAQIEVSQVRPWCEELVEAGLMTRRVTALEVSIDGEALASAPVIEVFEDTPPIPLHMIRTKEQYYAHDLRASESVRYLPGATVAELEDKAAARKGKVADKAERREANESMPHAHQAIAPGTPMLCEIRLNGATDVEWGCLLYAITRWIQHGARLGGGKTKGHGGCRVRVAGALRHQPGPGEVSAPGTALSVDLDTPEAHAATYVAHIKERAEVIREELAG